MLIRIVILSILLTLGVLLSVEADELLIITAKNYSEKHLNKKKISNIFLREQILNQQGERWVPVNLRSDHPLRLAFSKSFFDQRPEEMEYFWNIKYFQGITPPYVVRSQQAMMRFVTSTPNAIGYVLPCFVDDRVKVIFRIRVRIKKAFEIECNDEIR